MIARFMHWLLPTRPRFKPEENEFSQYLRAQKRDAQQAISQKTQSQDPVSRSVRGIPHQRSLKDGGR